MPKTHSPYSQLWERETLEKFSPGSLPWLHLLVSLIEPQHDLRFYYMVGTESRLTRSRGGRDAKPFPRHLGDQPGLNWMPGLNSHALFLGSTFSLLFFSKWDDQKPTLWCHLHLEVFCPLCYCFCCTLVTSPYIWMCLFSLHFPTYKASSWLWAGFAL